MASLKKSIAIALSLVSVLTLFSGCAKKEDKKVLVMATNAEFPPYEYYDQSKIVGIDIEIAQEIADNMGMELVVEDMAFESIIAAVQSGKADFAAAGMTIDEDRLLSVDFSNPYTTASQVIIVKEDSDIASPDDLAGKTIGVQIGTTGAIYAEDIENSTVERYGKGFEAVQALSQGKVDAVIIDREPAKVLTAQTTGLKILDQEFTNEEYAIAVQKGNKELVDSINKTLDELEKSGKLQEIIDKYISAD